MDELSEPEALGERARQLIGRAMTEDAPSPGDAEHSWGMVVSRVRDAEPPLAATPAPSPASRWIGAAVLAAALAAVVALGLWIVMAPKPAPAVPPPPPPAVGAAPSATPRPAEPPRTVTPAPLDAAATARLLDDAEAALLDAPARSLALLERHAELAPVDAQLPRRLALRIRSLCALGRVDEARHEGVAFLQHHGTTAAARDVRASCAVP